MTSGRLREIAEYIEQCIHNSEIPWRQPAIPSELKALSEELQAMKIDVPQVTKTDYLRAEEATDNAFSALLTEAKARGLTVAPVMGLMYLPTQDLTRNFQEACRAILMALTPAATHKRDGDGLEVWEGEGGA